MKAPTLFTLLALLIANIHPITGFSQCTLGAEYVTTTGTAGGTYNGGFEPLGAYTLNPTGTGIATGDPTFTTGAYTFFNCTDDGVAGPEPKINAGHYAIMSGNSSYCYGTFLTSGVVHGGTFAGLFDAPAASTSTMWCQTVTGLSSGTTYSFTANYRDAVSTDAAPPQVQMTIDYGSGAVNLGTAATVSPGPYAEAGCFTQASATSATICILMLTNGSGGGNDIFLDDISFKPVTGGSGCTAGTCTYIVTPVTLIDFNASKEDDIVKLTWSTATEVNNDYFLVEKSVDGIHFEPVGTVNGNGTSNQINYYTFYDYSVNSGIIYYRLKQVDFDNKYEYTKIKYVNIDNADPVIITYDPSSSQSELLISFCRKGEATFTIVDMLGRVVCSGSRVSDEPSVSVNKNMLCCGVYIVKVLIGSELVSKKIVLN